MDRDLLFGVIAVQLGQATATQVMAATSAYVTEPSKGIAERLRAEGVITAERFEMLSTMMDEAIKAHGGDVEQTMQSLGGEQAAAKNHEPGKLGVAQVARAVGLALRTLSQGKVERHGRGSGGWAAG